MFQVGLFKLVQHTYRTVHVAEFCSGNSDLHLVVNRFRIVPFRASTARSSKSCSESLVELNSLASRLASRTSRPCARSSVIGEPFAFADASLVGDAGWVGVARSADLAGDGGVGVVDCIAQRDIISDATGVCWHARGRLTLVGPLAGFFGCALGDDMLVAVTLLVL